MTKAILWLLVIDALASALCYLLSFIVKKNADGFLNLVFCDLLSCKIHLIQFSFVGKQFFLTIGIATVQIHRTARTGLAI